MIVRNGRVGRRRGSAGRRRFSPRDRDLPSAACRRTIAGLVPHAQLERCAWTAQLSAAGVLAVRAALLRSWLRGLGAFLLAGGDGRGRAVPVPVAVAVPVPVAVAVPIPVPVGLDRDALGDDAVEARAHPAQRAPGSRS